MPERKYKLKNLLEDTNICYYWIGYLLADGCISGNRLSLTSKDCIVLKNFCEYLDIDLSYIQKRTIKSNDYYTVSVMDTENIPKILEKYGEVKYYDEVKYGKKFFVLCHYPIASWNKQGRGSIMLHGHSHGSFPDKLYGKMLDVGWDAQGKILHFDEIIAKMEHREVKVIDHHKVIE